MAPWTSSQADGTTNRADHPGFQSRPVSKISQPIRLSPFTNAITGGRRKQARRKDKQESGGGAIDPEIHEATLRFFRSKRCARNRIIPRAANKTCGHAVWKKEIFLLLWEEEDEEEHFSAVFLLSIDTRRRYVGVLWTTAGLKRAVSRETGWKPASIGYYRALFPRCGRTGRVCLVKWFVECWNYRGT